MAVNSMIVKTAAKNSREPDWYYQSTRETLSDQILWLIKLRWLAVLGTLLGILISTSPLLFPIFSTAHRVWLLGCVAVLFISNVIYYLLVTGDSESSERKNIILAMFQLELDLIILTGLLHFSGGVMNPFVLFYAFHIIIGAIILPKNLAIGVGLSAVLLYCGMVLGEMQGWVRHYPMLATQGIEAWKDWGFVLWAMSAFVGMVVLAHFLTRTVITRMRKKELEAARHHEVLTAVVNAMSEGLVFLTSDGKLSVCNRAAQDWLINGVATDDSIRLDDFPKALKEHFTQLGQHPADKGAVSKVIHYGSMEKGERYIELKSCAVEDMEQQRLGYVVVGEDLTEHKKLEQDLRMRTAEITKINEVMRKSQMEMAEQEKLAALGQMASGIAHEIGNPLNSLSSIAQYLGRRYNTESDKKQFNLIHDQIKRISNILEHMLGLARPASSKFTWMDVNAVIDETLALIKYDKRAQIVKIESIANESLPTVWFRRNNLEQVLLNVFLNALYALDVRGGGEAKTLAVRREAHDGHIEIRVSDNGIGMSEEVRQHAFDPFYTTKEPGKGTGLGLYISRNLMEDNGGSITLEDNPGGGITAVIRFPTGPVKGLMEQG